MVESELVNRHKYQGPEVQVSRCNTNFIVSLRHLWANGIWLRANNVAYCSQVPNMKQLTDSKCCSTQRDT